ncbi:MAG: aminoglycoside phosphotransferase family protein [Lentisphaeria bacterium]|nr:aminoglycoside phosphotransferase family protein [Lentisphaeria bacterium]
MPGEFIGYLPEHDPLFPYLKNEIFSGMGCSCPAGIKVYKTNGSNEVYVYEDASNAQKVVGKFFYSQRMNDWDLAWKRLDREYKNLLEFRSYLDPFYHYVAKPLGRNDDLNRLLVVEYCYGEPLENIIMRSINENDEALLFGKLKALAYFLARVHNHSAAEKTADFEKVCQYFCTVVSQLESITSSGEREYLYSCCRQWHDEPFMWQDREVLVHGDATPANFFFGDDIHVISFDMERNRRTDRMFDTGRLAAELQHFFFRATGNKENAEKFIGHFFWEYACHFPDREKAFSAITQRAPFYIGMNLLRIARNDYLSIDYRRQLIEEAKKTLHKN